jgi:hypothetical protein
MNSNQFAFRHRWMTGNGGIYWSSADQRPNSKRTFATLRKKTTEHWAGINESNELIERCVSEVI